MEKPTTPSESRELGRPWRLWPALGLVVAANLFGGLAWLQQNTIFVGHDASKYLQASLEFTQFLNFSPQALFQAFTYDPYRPPALFIIVQPLLALFGLSSDSAQLANLFLLGAVVILTYLLGAQVATPRVGLLAAGLVGLWPILFAMSRLFYTEMLLTTLVTLNLLALYRARGFTRRGWTLVWGVSFGAGLLVKWTMPIYVALPLLWFLWRADWLQLRQVRPQPVKLHWLAAGGAVAGAGVLALLWFWPNRTALAELPAGDWALLGWWALLACLFYLLARPATPVTNWVTGLLLAAVVASVWYLPYADFMVRLLVTDQDRGATTSTPLNAWNYVRYLYYLYWEHLGPAAFWIVVPTALAPWLWAAVRRRPVSELAPPLWLSILSALGALVLIAQANARNLTPLIPGFTVLAVVGLQVYPRRLRPVIIALWLVVLVSQWALFTFDGLFPLYQRTETLWARSSYVVPPASGVTDPGYAILPDILNEIGGDATERQQLALLVNIPQLHRGALRNQIFLDRRDIRIKDVTEELPNPWANILTSAWVLLKDGDNRDVEGPGRELSQQLLAGDPIFQTLYAEVKRYPLPNGETVALFHRRENPFGYPQMQTDLLAATQPAAELIGRAWSPHATLVYGNSDLAFWVTLHGTPTAPARVLNEATAAPASAFSGLTDTVLVVSAAAANGWLSWLEGKGYHAVAIGNDFAGLDIYGLPQAPLQTVTVTATWPDVALTTLRTLPSIEPGQVLPLETGWSTPEGANWKASYRLLDGAGTVVASLDRPLLPNDRLGLFALPETPPGEYAVAVVVYDATTLEPVPDLDRTSPTVLTQVEIVGEQ